MRKINSLIVYGHSGTGKTSMVAKAMPNALWVVTRKTNLDGYHDWIEQNAALATELGCSRIPANRVIQVPFKSIDDEGRMVNEDTRAFIDAVLRSYLRRCKAGELQGGIVFDEFSVFAKRAYQDMTRTDRNGFSVTAKFKDWVAEICEVGAVTEQPACLICHANDPKYDEETGKLKYKGGPAMPIGTVIGEICALPDMVLQLMMVEDSVTGAVRRVVKTEAHPLWERKSRLWGVPPEMEPDLRKLLADRAGWYVKEVNNT